MSSDAGHEREPDGESVGWRTYVLDLVSSGSAVLMVGLLLFSVSGVWPPMVAIESGSMEPHIDTGDLVFVVEADRFPGPGHREGTGVVTAAAGERTGYRTFQGHGDVIVYRPDGRENATPIIHRAMFWVEEGDRWFDRTDPRYVPSDVGCGDVPTCPAPHDGFVTKGDGNDGYDQISGLRGCRKEGPCELVRPSWVEGRAVARIPFLGRIRLTAGRAGAEVAANATPTPTNPSVSGA